MLQTLSSSVLTTPKIMFALHAQGLLCACVCTRLDRHLSAKWLCEALVLFEYVQNIGLQGSTLSERCLTMSFGPLKLLTHSLLQKGWTTHLLGLGMS